MSAMILNYPPPTVINLFEQFESQMEREKARLKSIRDYLSNDKLVNDEDLLLIVDGQDTWFQLPSDVIIRQYQNVVADANKRLMNRYGADGDGAQKYSQTIVFGAEKRCQGEDLACKYAPESMLPENIYGKETGKDTTTTPAKYLDSGVMIGPAKDLRTLFEVAVKNFEAENSQSGTAQSVFATIFGEQQMARDTGRKASKPLSELKWFSWFGGRAGTQTTQQEAEPSSNVTLEGGQQYEFSIGLDYTHTLFQSFLYSAEDELHPLTHNTDLSNYRHADTPTPPLSIPTALLQAQPPFWTPDLSKKNPSPNEKPSFVEPLQIQKELDDLKPRKTSWNDLLLIQNTYTGAIPAIFHLNLASGPLKSRQPYVPRSPSPRFPSSHAHSAPSANLTWDDLWYSGYERALLRKYLRVPQSPIGYHAAAVGGDKMWDQRGGRGGVWTEKEEMWLPWGEVDGVCGTLEQLERVFGDGKGVWLHEHEENAEEERRKKEEELKKKIEEDRKKEEERLEKEKKKKIESEKAIADETREKLRKEKEAKQKEEEEKKKKEEEEERKKKEEEEAEAKKKEQEEAEAKKKQGQEATEHIEGVDTAKARR